MVKFRATTGPDSHNHAVCPEAGCRQVAQVRYPSTPVSTKSPVVSETSPWLKVQTSTMQVRATRDSENVGTVMRFDSSVNTNCPRVGRLSAASSWPEVRTTVH